MTAASDNKFPKLIITEGSAPSSPSAGDQKVYIDSTSHHLSRKNSSGTVVDLETNQSSTALVRASVNYTGGDYASLSSTTFADLDATNLSLTLTTGAHRCLIGVVCTATIATAPQSICLDIDVDGSRLGQTFGLQAVDVNHNAKAVNMSFVHQMTNALSAGSHTFKVQYRVTGNFVTFYASTGVTPFGFWVAELAA